MREPCLGNASTEHLLSLGNYHSANKKPRDERTWIHPSRGEVEGGSVLEVFFTASS